MAEINDRRRSQDEKKQIEIIKEVIREISRENKENISTDLEDFDDISNGNGYGGQYINENGHMTSSLRIKRNHFYDAKALDGVVYYESKKTKDRIDVYFVCKYTEGTGGIQDDIPMEIGRTIENFKKNRDNKVGIFFLEGPYWKPSIIEEGRFDNEKTFHATRENLKEILVGVLKSNNILNV